MFKHGLSLVFLVALALGLGVTSCGSSTAGNNVEITEPDQGGDPGDGFTDGSSSTGDLVPGEVKDAKEGPDGEGDIGPDRDGLDTVDAGKDQDGLPQGVTIKTLADAGEIPVGEPLHFYCKAEGLPEETQVTFSLIVEGEGEFQISGMDVTFEADGVFEVACKGEWEGGQGQDETPLQILVRPGEIVSAETTLSKQVCKAGETVSVTCTFFDQFGNEVVRQAMVIVDPQVGLDIIGTNLLAKKVGSYQVACREPVTQVVDHTPATLQVTPGNPKKIITTLSENQIQAGNSSTVSCKAEDDLGNTVIGFPITVFISQGLAISGFSISGTKVGSYQVICVPQDEPWQYFILQPQPLTIIPGPPAHMNMTPVPQKPIYKMFENVTFIRSATDAYDNIVPDAVFSPITCDPTLPGIEQTDETSYHLGAEGVFIFRSCLQENMLICDQETIMVDGYGPVINIKYPQRGATVDGKNSIMVVGSVIDPVGGVASFRINGTELVSELDEDGNFLYPIESKQGMNLIVAIAEDSSGMKTIHAQSYYYSPTWYPMDLANPTAAKIADGILFFICQDFFDDGDHNHAVPNDLATIMEITLANLNLGSLISNPVWQGGPYRLNVNNITFSPPKVIIDTKDGGLTFWVEIKNIKIYVKAIGECNFIIDWCPDVSGYAALPELTMWFDIAMSASNGNVTSTLVDSKVDINTDVSIHLDGILGFLFDWLANFILSFFQEDVRNMVGPMVTSQIQGLLSSITDMLNFKQDLSIPNPVNPSAPPVVLNLDTMMQELFFLETGMFLRLKASVLTGKEIDKTPLGSIGRADCLAWDEAEFQFTTAYYAQIGLFDDLLNEILFSAWWGGLLDMDVPLEQFVDPEELTLEGFGTLSDLGISDIDIRTEFFLPPILTSCNLDESGEEQLELHIGDIYLELTMKLLNEPVAIGMFLSAAAPAVVEVLDTDTGQKISFAIGEFDPMVSQVTYVSDSLEGAEGFMSMIVRGVIVPTLMSNLAEAAMQSFDLPTINLSELSPMLPQGIELRFVVDEFNRYQGYTALYPHFEAVQ